MIPVPAIPIKNFAWVSRNALARGGQPEADGYEWLVTQHFRSIVCLRKEHDDAYHGSVPHELTYLYLPIQDRHAPTNDDVSHFLDFVQKPENQPCFVHCGEGSGRAGIMCALYRYVVSRWPLDRIRKEAEDHRVPHWALSIIGWLDPRQRRYFQHYVSKHPRP